jgi:streptogramin lyase
VGADGSIWFTEQTTNRLGRLMVNKGRPLDIGAANVQHYNIPSGVRVNDPIPSDVNRTILTSEPHSVVLDRSGLVWFSEERTAKMGYLDPAKAVPNTSRGITVTRFVPSPPLDRAYGGGRASVAA